MQVNTTRFGIIEIEQERVISFPQGLLGFPEHTRFCLLEPGEDACFFWLQSVDDASLAFVVTDPALFVPGYRVPLRPEQASAVQLKDQTDAQILCIVNKIAGQLTANLQGPLVVNTLDRVGQQLILADRRWTTHHPLLAVAGKSPASPITAPQANASVEVTPKPQLAAST